MDLPPRIADTVREQAGVVSRRQLLAGGVTDGTIRSLLGRRELRRLFPGVYVDHTGPPTWQQRAWAGVLYADGILYGASALRAAHGPGRRGDDDDLIHLAVPAGRRVRPQDGLRIVRCRNLEAMTLGNASPPRQRYEEAAIDVALEAGTDIAALATLTTACQKRRTTARRLAASLSSRRRVPRRLWLMAVLRDIAEGTCSVLEREYLTRVERAHGLPRGGRQVWATASAGVIYRDVEYGDLLIELDGREFHDSAAARDRDMERDLDAAVEGKATTRIGWGQVHERPCRTADKVARLLKRHGWRGDVRSCGVNCRIAETNRA